MKIKLITNDGVETIKVKVIEPGLMNPGTILIDKGERDDGRYVIDLVNIICITD